MTLKTDLDRLAHAIAEKAALKDTTITEATDALKSLTAYYAVLNKGRKAAEPESDGATFGDFSKSITDIEDEEPHGRPKTKLRSRFGHA